MPIHSSGRSFFQREVAGGGAGTTTKEVRSSLSRLVISQDPDFAAEHFCWVDATKNFVLFADVVVLQGDFVMQPGNSFTIAARVIETYGGLPSSISVNGTTDNKRPQPGQPVGDARNGDNGAFRPSEALCTHHDEATDGLPGTHGNPGDDGGSGGNAGAITLLAHTLKGPLTLKANGGNGVDGAAGGPGGKGGDGGYGTYSNWLGLFGAAHTVWGEVDIISPGDGERGGDGGPGGRGGDGGNGGRIMVHLATALPPTLTCEARGGAAGRNGDSGAPGPGGFRPELKNREFPAKQPNYERRQAPSGGQRVQAGVPVAGLDGNLDVRVVPANDFLNYVDPIQLEMLLQRIFAGYVVAGLDANKTPSVTEPLQWVEMVLAPVLEPACRQNLPLERVKLFERLYARTADMLGRLVTGLDAFGHDKTFAPSPSVGTFDASLTTNLAAFKEVEDEYRSFLTQLAEREEIKANSAVVINGAEAKKRAAEDEKRKVLGRIEALQSAIDKARKDCAILRSKARDSQHELMQAINAKFNFTDVNALLGAFEMMCFVPPTTPAGAAMAVGQIGKLAYNGMTTISRDDGVIEPKDKVIESLQRLEGTVDTAANAAASTYQDGSETAKLLLSLEQYQQAVEKFRSLDGAPGVIALVATMVEKFRHKNTLVLEYNDKLRTYYAMQALISECDDTIAQAGASLSKVSDPSFPLMASFLGLLHDRMKAEIVAKIELANRAYAFYTLDTDYRVFPDVLATKDFTDPEVFGSIDAAIISACIQRLRDRLLDTLSEAQNEPLPFSDYVLVIDDQDVLNDLKEDKRTWFLIDRVSNGARSFHVPAWTTATDVRLTEVAVYLRGAKVMAKDGQPVEPLISVGVTHGETDAIYKTDKHALNFSHGTTSRYLFAYDPTAPDEAAVRTRATISCDQVSPRMDKRAYYAGVGPFSLWDLDLEPAANPNLNLDDLTRIDIHFKGHLRPTVLENRIPELNPMEVTQ